jgi:hypothetical protein
MKYYNQVYSNFIPGLLETIYKISLGHSFGVVYILRMHGALRPRCGLPARIPAVPYVVVSRQYINVQHSHNNHTGFIRDFLSEDRRELISDDKVITSRKNLVT